MNSLFCLASLPNLCSESGLGHVRDSPTIMICDWRAGIIRSSENSDEVPSTQEKGKHIEINRFGGLSQDCVCVC